MGRSFVLEMVVSGDLVLDEPDAGHWLSGIAPALQRADVAVGHLEVPHTRGGVELAGDVPAPGAPPENLSALAEAGFDMLSLGGNHIADCGAEGIEDTISGLDSLGIVHTGAGRNLAAARRPARIEAGGRRIALLSYNCVGPEAGWAAEDRAGSAYLRVLSADGSPTAPATPLQSVAPEAFEVLRADIEDARKMADIVLVALHKGIVHTPAVLADYERPLAHAAIEAGADLVVGHHSHILRGVETVNGVPIFHGLGNFVTVTRALSLDNDHPARREWARKRRELFGFTPDPDYPTYPFHPEAKHAMIADCRIDESGKVSAGFRPCFITPSGAPELLGPDARGQALLEYVAGISRAAGRRTEFAWDGERVVFQ